LSCDVWDSAASYVDAVERRLETVPPRRPDPVGQRRGQIPLDVHVGEIDGTEGPQPSPVAHRHDEVVGVRLPGHEDPPVLRVVVVRERVGAHAGCLRNGRQREVEFHVHRIRRVHPATVLGLPVDQEIEGPAETRGATDRDGSESVRVTRRARCEIEGHLPALGPGAGRDHELPPFEREGVGRIVGDPDAAALRADHRHARRRVVVAAGIVGRYRLAGRGTAGRDEHREPGSETASHHASSSGTCAGGGGRCRVGVGKASVDQAATTTHRVCVCRHLLLVATPHAVNCRDGATSRAYRSEKLLPRAE